MRKLLMILFMILSLSGFSQKVSMKKVPITVITTFRIKFPQAHKVHWFYDKEENIYFALFRLDRVPHECEFNTDGKWVITEIDTDRDSLPKLVADSIDAHFPNYEIVEVQTIQFSLNNTVVYLVDIENHKGDKEMILRMSSEGMIIEIKKYKY